MTEIRGIFSHHSPKFGIRHDKFWSETHGICSMTKPPCSAIAKENQPLQIPVIVGQ